VIRRYALAGGAIGLMIVVLERILLARGVSLPGWALALVSAGVGAAIGWLTSRRDFRDVRSLQRGIERLRARDYNRRVRLRSSGPIGDLGRSLDELAEGLSAREETQDQRKDRLQAILDAMTEAVMVTDSRGRITLANRVLSEWVGFDVEGKTATEAIRHPDFHRAVREAQQGAPCSLEIEIGGVAGRPPRAIRASVSPLRARHGVVSVFHDITAERAADRVRRDFVANASHELRTPLTAIRGFAETLRDGAIEDPESALGFVDVILRHTKRLQTLVDDLADLSRFEGQELKLELGPVDAGALVAQVVRGLESQSRAKELRIVTIGLQNAPRVAAEERALEQVLVNLIDNAIKYTPQGGQIRIGMETQENDVVIQVGNSGPGIPSKHLPRVFERFYRVDAGRSRELGGTGLGLSIVKHLVAKMGAEVTVQSEAGWTQFEVRLAAADSSKSDTQPLRIGHS
jgi:two-component system phosphate regulon sensor histidine kinase PhoR